MKIYKKIIKKHSWVRQTSYLLISIAVLSILVLIISLFDSPNEKVSAAEGGSFQEYWYQGKAEITRYELAQARYGETHKGDAVLIFVTEDFLTDKQVKLDRGSSSKAASVLKLNFTRNFNTGIYPYSMMNSIFTPVDVRKWEHTLKTTFSNQEWCGHTYTQLNFRNNRFEGVVHSYFQDEADKEFRLKPALLEDEIWTRIRISPQTLPEGEIEIIPGSHYARLRHVEQKVEKATARLTMAKKSSSSDNELHVYTVTYPEHDRSLSITFEKRFPYSILGWEEQYASGFGAGKKILTTKAVKTHSLFTDYWNKNSAADSKYRKELGL